MLLAAALTHPLQAADLPVVHKAPPSMLALQTDWAGFYLGIGGGYAWAGPNSTQPQS
jgi:hypothetical protein